MAHYDDKSFLTIASTNINDAETNLVENVDITSLVSDNLPLVPPTSMSISPEPFKDHIRILGDNLSTVNQSIENDPDEIWEKLNSRCHKKFGYGSEIKQPTKDDLKWGTDILPIYADWNKLKDFKSLIEIWITKINEYMQKNVILSLSSSSTSIPLSPSTSVPLSFATLMKGKNVRNDVNYDVEMVEINVENEVIENEDVKNEIVQNEDVKNGTEGIYFYYYRINKCHYY